MNEEVFNHVISYKLQIQLKLCLFFPDYPWTYTMRYIQTVQSFHLMLRRCKLPHLVFPLTSKSFSPQEYAFSNGMQGLLCNKLQCTCQTYYNATVWRHCLTVQIQVKRYGHFILDVCIYLNYSWLTKWFKVF